MASTSKPKTTGSDEQKQKAKARAEAVKRLIDAHPDEYRTLMQQAHLAHGVKYNPRLTAEERARKQVEALLAEYPAIKDDLAG